MPTPPTQIPPPTRAGAQRTDPAFRVAAITLLVAAAVLYRPASALAQDSTVAGVVLGTGGAIPLEGARVTIEGTPLLQTTGSNGRFRFQNVSGTEVTLRVARVGYQPASRVVRIGATDLSIVLREASVQLDEIVVTGQPQGTERRAVGNSIATIDAPAALELSGAGDLTRLINGRAPGVTIVPNSGRAGAGPTITVRGLGSLSLNSEPLLYIDGIRVTNDVETGPTGAAGGSVISRLNDIAPEDIASIEIIKGPAAATIYGTEASNGVIQVITKKGRVGKPQIGINVKQGTNWFQDPEGRIPTNYGFDGAGGILSQNLVQEENDRGTPIWTNGYSQSYNVSASGGSEAVQYYLSGTYDDENGIEPTNSLRRFAGHANLSFPINDELDIGTSLNYVRGETHLGMDYSNGVFFNTLYGFPFLRDTPTRGFLVAPPEAYYSGVFDNTQDVSRFTGSLTVNHRPLAWLSHRLILGLDQTAEDNQALSRFAPPEVAQFFDPATARGGVFVNRRDIAFYTGDYSATANVRLSPRISSATSVGGQYYQRRIDTLGVQGSEFPAPGLSTGIATARTFGSQDFVTNKTIGLFGQQQFGLNDRVFLTGAVRVDNNSAFGDNFDLATYPKVSGTWVVSEEPFWRLGFVSALKLRAAYGASGQQPQSFAALRTYAPSTGPNDLPTVTPQFVGNPDLKPERGEEIEVGFEAGLFDRIGIDFTVFSKQTEDAILLRGTPPSGGFPGEQFVNIGAVSNKGVELQVNAQVITTPNFAWDLGAGVATASNYIKDLGGSSGIATGFTPQRNVPGYPIASFFIKRVVSAEVDPATGAVTSALCDGGPGAAAVSCDEAPLVFAGTPIPKVTGAFTSTVTLFRNFRLYGLVDFKRGHRRLDTDRLNRCVFIGNCLENASPEGVDPRLLADMAFGADLQTINSFVDDAGFFKLREISASYTLPERWAGLVGATGATITVSGRNLHTWTSYGGLDPESRSAQGEGGELQFLDQAVTPTLAQFVTTFSLNF
ncbi:MAG: TonB-dependent receptor [Gemmatimonadales bacterium]|nr:TonB-dependent receptor [Gemmatimonadales bacterium]